MITAQRSYPVCNVGNVDWLHTLNFELPVGNPLAKGYDVVQCAGCGFVYSDTTVSQAEYDLFYSHISNYENYKTGTGGGENPYDLARLEETAHQIAYFQTYTNKTFDKGFYAISEENPNARF